MTRPGNVRSGRQSGIVTVLAVVVLVVVVLLWLRQALDITGTTSLADARQESSTAALFLAESGVERAVGVLNANRTDITSEICRGLQSGGRFPPTPNAPRYYEVYEANPSPDPCGTTDLCSSCTIKSKGVVDASSRTIRATIRLPTVEGVSCNAATETCTNTSKVNWQLTLKNSDTSQWAIGIFNTAALSAVPGDTITCGTTNCIQAWTEAASNSRQNSVGAQGNVIPIGPAISSRAGYDATQNPPCDPKVDQYKCYPDSIGIYQQLSTNINAAEVGVLLRGSRPTQCNDGAYGKLFGTPPFNLSGTPCPGLPKLIGSYQSGLLSTGSYWDDTNTHHTVSVGNSQSTGATTDGALTADVSSCTSPPATTSPQAGSTQSCTSWCFQAERMIFGFAARTASASETPGTVTFNTGVGKQNIPFTRIAHFPDGSDPGAPTNVVSEVWVSPPNLNWSYGLKFNGTIATEQYVPNPAITVTNRVSESPSCTLTLSSVGTLQLYDEIDPPSKTNSRARITGITGNQITLNAACSGSGGNDPTGATIKVYRKKLTITSFDGTSMTKGNSCFPSFANSYCESVPVTGETLVSSIYVNPSATYSADQPHTSLGSAIAGTGVIEGTQILSGTDPVAGYYLATPGNAPQDPLTTTMTAGAYTLIAESSTLVFLPGWKGNQLPLLNTSETGNIPLRPILNIRAGGGGVLAPQTRAGADITPATGPYPALGTMTLNVTSRLRGAQLCGGACAFFDHTSTLTNFALGTGPSGYWAAGFACVANADLPPKKITSTKVKFGAWFEEVRP